MPSTRQERARRTVEHLNKFQEAARARTERKITEQLQDAAQSWGFDDVKSLLAAARKDPQLRADLPNEQEIFRETVAELAHQSPGIVAQAQAVLADLQDRVDAVQAARQAELTRLGKHLGAPHLLPAQARAALLDHPLTEIVTSELEGDDLSRAVVRTMAARIAAQVPEAFLAAEAAGAIDPQIAKSVWDHAAESTDTRLTHDSAEGAGERLDQMLKAKPTAEQERGADEAGAALDRMLRGEPAEPGTGEAVEAVDPSLFPDAGEADAGPSGADSGGADTADTGE